MFVRRKVDSRADGRGPAGSSRHDGSRLGADASLQRGGGASRQVLEVIGVNQGVFSRRMRSTGVWEVRRVIWSA